MDKRTGYLLVCSHTFYLPVTFKLVTVPVYFPPLEHAESLHEHLHKSHFNLERSLLWARDISKGRKHLVVFYYMHVSP